MQHTLGIILAAGRGSRMKGFTDHKPKCLLELAHKPLLQWQIEALHKAGIMDVLVMRGYKASLLSPEALPWTRETNISFLVADNPQWETSNMLRTLWCADACVQQAFAQGASQVLVSYADIVYHFQHICDLLTSTQAISMAYDTAWEELWRLRFDDPLSDAESFLQEDGILKNIGEKPQSIQDIHGQYMGLLRFSQEGWNTLCKTCISLGEKVNTTDMTTFLRLLLTQGERIATVAVQGKWCEADNQQDLHAYEKMLQQKNWLHDWRYS